MAKISVWAAIESMTKTAGPAKTARYLRGLGFKQCTAAYLRARGGVAALTLGNLLREGKVSFEDIEKALS